MALLLRPGRRADARVPVLLLASLVGCGGTAPEPASPPSAGPAPSAAPPPAAAEAPIAKAVPEHIAADAPRATAGGTTFTVPGGWTIAADGARTVLTGPEPDLRLALVETDAKTAEDAVAKAWPALREGFQRPLRIAHPRPGRHGWEEARNFEYETSPDEKLVVFAQALRRGDAWTTFLVESGQASFEKRMSAIQLLRESLRPKGFARESFSGKKAATLDAARIKAITDLVEEGQRALDVPGVAISLVQDGKVVFQGGFGVRELGKPAKVDADTLFIIASNTKAMTTLLLAKEVDEGKFTWETPVTSVYPDFKLGDAATTAQVQMKHLVCACTGLPRQDLEWFLEYARSTPKGVFATLGTFQPTTRFGETFQYSNTMAAAAGYVGGFVAYPKKELGAAYDEAMKTKLFAPMGMAATTFDFAKALAQNHASAHSQDVDGAMKVATMEPNRSVIPVRPAGGAWSSVRDVTRYVQMELAKGKLPNGKPLLSEAALLARRAPQVKVGETMTYGMGLEVETEWGAPIVHHGGDLIGFHSDMFWLPEHGVGGVILTNADGGHALRRPFLRKVLEVLFDGRAEAREDVLASAKRLKDEIKKERERLVVPPAPDAVAKLAKRYTSEALGDVTVLTKGGRTVFDIGEWQSGVASRKNDDGTTSFFTIDPGLAGLELVVGERGGKRVLVTRDMQHEYVFTEAK